MCVIILSKSSKLHLQMLQMYADISSVRMVGDQFCTTRIAPQILHGVVDSWRKSSPLVAGRPIFGQHPKFRCLLCSCSFSSNPVPKRLWQNPHWYLFSWRWRCFRKEFLFEYVLSHFEQLKVFPEWERTCWSRVYFSVNVFSHTEHSKRIRGCPEWCCWICLLRVCLCTSILPQWGHTFFWPLWVSSWRSSSVGLAYFFPHSLQARRFSFVCFCLSWNTSCFFVL